MAGIEPILSAQRASVKSISTLPLGLELICEIFWPKTNYGQLDVCFIGAKKAICSYSRYFATEAKICSFLFFSTEIQSQWHNFFRFQPLFSSFFFVPRSMKSPFCSATCITMFLILIQCSDAFLNIQKRLTQQKILFSFILSLSSRFFVAVASHVFHVLFFYSHTSHLH